MVEYKINYCFVSYSDETAPYWTLGFMPYTALSYVITIHLGEGIKKKEDLSKYQVTLMNEGKKQKYPASAIFQQMEEFLGQDKSKNPACLGGKLGHGLSTKKEGDSKPGKSVWGYIFSIQYGQRGLQWFASRSEKVEAPSEDDIPDTLETDEEKEYWLQVRSPHTFGELAKLIGMEEEQEPQQRYYKSASKTQPSPKFAKDAPGRSSLPPKKREIKGLPESRVTAQEEEEQVPTDEEVRAAFDVIFKALRQGAIRPEFEYESLFQAQANEAEEDIESEQTAGEPPTLSSKAKTGEGSEEDSEQEESKRKNEKPSTYYFKGYVGSSAGLNEFISNTKEVNDKEGIKTYKIEPKLTMRLLRFRRVPE